jgi:hypothetical protein
VELNRHNYFKDEDLISAVRKYLDNVDNLPEEPHQYSIETVSLGGPDPLTAGQEALIQLLQKLGESALAEYGENALDYFAPLPPISSHDFLCDASTRLIQLARAGAISVSIDIQVRSDKIKPDLIRPLIGALSHFVFTTGSHIRSELMGMYVGGGSGAHLPITTKDRELIRNEDDAVKINRMIGGPSDGRQLGQPSSN